MTTDDFIVIYEQNKKVTKLKFDKDLAIRTEDNLIVIKIAQKRLKELVNLADKKGISLKELILQPEENGLLLSDLSSDLEKVTIPLNLIHEIIPLRLHETENKNKKVKFNNPITKY